jgi:membrane associated rhomboid family serine protease
MSDLGFQTPTHPIRQRRPLPVTYTAIAAVAIIHLGLRSQQNPYAIEVLFRWGYATSDKIWRGAYWSLFTSVFVHIETWHAVFNIYWLYVLGRVCEPAIGSVRYLTFFILASIISSGIQLGVSGQNWAWCVRCSLCHFRIHVGDYLALSRIRNNSHQEEYPIDAFLAGWMCHRHVSECLECRKCCPYFRATIRNGRWCRIRFELSKAADIDHALYILRCRCRIVVLVPLVCGLVELQRL